MCACEGEQRVCRSISPLRPRRLLCPLRFLHPAHRHSIPIHHPPFYAADRWSLALGAPVNAYAHTAELYFLAIKLESIDLQLCRILPFSTSPLLWAPSEVTSHVNTRGSVIRGKKRTAVTKSSISVCSVT